MKTERNNIYRKVCHSMTTKELKKTIEASKRFLESAEEELNVRKNKTYNEIVDFLINNRFVRRVTLNGDKSGSVKTEPASMNEERSIINLLQDNGFSVYDINVESVMVEEPIKEIVSDKEYTLKKAVYERTVEFKFSYK